MLGVYGREFLIYDCDPFTKAWYAKQGIDQSNVLDVTENKPPRTKPDLPPYNGYGLVDDSAQNCVSLLPKPPKARVQDISAPTPPLIACPPPPPAR